MAADIRKSLPTFGRWVGEILSAESKWQSWAPEGCAQGFLVLIDTAEFLYKMTGYYAPTPEPCIAWNDSHLAINSPETIQPQISAKEKAGATLKHAEVFG